MTYDELMMAFGAKIGLDDFKPEGGYCELRSAETVFSFQDCPELGTVLLTAPVCDVTPDEDPAFLRAALEANCMFAETAGSTLSIDRETGALMLCRYDALEEMDAERYLRLFEAFAGVVQRWRERRQGGTVASGDDSAGPASAPTIMDFA